MPRAPLPPYIVKQRNVCFARMTVPAKLVAIVGCKFFKASTVEANPHKAYAKPLPWITDWQARITAARAAATGLLNARTEWFAQVYARYRNAALDTAGRAPAMDAIEFHFQRIGGTTEDQQDAALPTQPDAIAAMPVIARPSIAQASEHATPLPAHFPRWQAVTHLKGRSLPRYVSDIKEFAAAVKEPIETLSGRHVQRWVDERLAELDARRGQSSRCGCIQGRPVAASRDM